MFRSLKFACIGLLLACHPRQWNQTPLSRRPKLEATGWPSKFAANHFFTLGRFRVFSVSSSPFDSASSSSSLGSSLTVFFFFEALVLGFAAAGSFTALARGGEVTKTHTSVNPIRHEIEVSHLARENTFPSVTSALHISTKMPATFAFSVLRHAHGHARDLRTT